MTELGLATLVAFLICVPWWFFENYKQRPLSEFPELEQMMGTLFPDDLADIRAKGSLSRVEHLRYLKTQLKAIKAEIKRRDGYIE
ncbi:hypothetical protein VNPA120661_67010 [Pseudomonas aeruginosa]|jgi:hypothetical protein|nr:MULTISPECIES: hypothetical protein [Pseudomonas]ERV72993.1 hypothetical protein Q041_06235 [Pseudomonas aeruginosa BWHPSA028]MCL8303578.1 hypothetical protein [Pseudomonas putida]MCT5852323.1 hypothetical protein [Pseudomonas aeruginosa]SOV26435.1 hypothetical protein RW109_RW109_00508 [Pseudomonas aeruginosa]VCZ31469.1 hypothetical protein BANRA_06161 [Pseudomonas aeruginosa]